MTISPYLNLQQINPMSPDVDSSFSLDQELSLYEEILNIFINFMETKTIQENQIIKALIYLPIFNNIENIIILSKKTILPIDKIALIDYFIDFLNNAPTDYFIDISMLNAILNFKNQYPQIKNIFLYITKQFLASSCFQALQSDIKIQVLKETLINATKLNDLEMVKILMSCKCFNLLSLNPFFIIEFEVYTQEESIRELFRFKHSSNNTNHCSIL